MRDISRRVEQARRERLRNTIFVFFLLVSGLIALFPLAVDSVKWHETLYCLKTSSCTGSDIRRGIRYLIESEIRNNSQFGENVKVITHLPPDDGIAPFLGLAGAILLLAAAISSAALTNHQKQHTHTVLKQIKIQAIQESLEEGFTLDIHKFSLAAQNEVQKELVRRDAGSAIASLKTTDEETLDHLKGLRAGELATLNHANDVIDLKLQLLQKEETLKKSSSTPSPKTPAKSLEHALKDWEGGYLWHVVSSLKPLWLVGNQGSGKTWTAAAIALSRKYLFDAPVVTVFDRHAESDNTEIWKFLKPELLAYTEEDIIAAMQHSIVLWQNRMKERPKQGIQMVCDEFTVLRDLVGEICNTWFKLSLSDTRKARTYIIGVTHNTTNDSFPPGTAGFRKAGSILIEKFSANGETPLPRVVIRYGFTDPQGNPLEDYERTLPKWFTPNSINAHFNGNLISFDS